MTMRPSLRARVGRNAHWPVWALSRAFGVAGLYGFAFYGLRGVFGTSSDVIMYGGWAWLFQHGHLPYASYPVMYPPGVLPFLVIPAIRASLFQVEFVGLALAADAYVFHRLRAADRRGGAWLWLSGAVLIGPIFWARLDVFLAAAVVLAVLEFNRHRPERAALWLGGAVALKVWPIFLLVALAMAVTDRRRLRTIGCGLAVPVLCTLPVAAWGGLPGLWEAVRSQAGRGVEVESVFALPAELARAFHIGSILPSLTLSWEFDGHVGTVLGGIATLVTAIGAAGWVVAVVRRRRLTPFPMAQATLLLVVILVATAKVLSPQYALWVLAAAAVVCDGVRPRRRLVACTGAFLLSTQALFPFAFRGLILGDWPSTVVAVIHVGAVMALLLAAGACLPPLPVSAVVPARESEPGATIPAAPVKVGSVPMVVTG